MGSGIISLSVCLITLLRAVIDAVQCSLLTERTMVGNSDQKMSTASIFTLYFKALFCQNSVVIQIYLYFFPESLIFHLRMQETEADLEQHGISCISFYCPRSHNPAKYKGKDRLHCLVKEALGDWREGIDGDLGR